MVAFVSEDQGNSWPAYLDVMSSPEGNLIFWESKIVEFADGRTRKRKNVSYHRNGTCYKTS